MGFAAHATTVQTGTFTTLPANSPTALVEGKDGSFYFLGVAGDDRDLNAVFKATPSGTVVLVTQFTERDGIEPTGLLMASDGNLYGTFMNDARSTSAFACGSIFKLTTSGNLTTLHLFVGGDEGSGPSTGLIQGRDGNFYGTTQFGGAGGPNPGEVTIFQITPAGQVTTLYQCRRLLLKDGRHIRSRPVPNMQQMSRR
jgi:uncharacterized repeat protein (TIGR03803 family)